MQNKDQNLKQNRIYTSVIVLDDGETWSGSGKILYLTESAYNHIANGGDISDLGMRDIVKEQLI